MERVTFIGGPLDGQERELDFSPVKWIYSRPGEEHLGWYERRPQQGRNRFVWVARWVANPAISSAF